MPTTEEYAVADDGVRLYCKRMGDGPNVVVIPNAIHMVDSFAWLARRHTAIFFDLRNRGASDAVSDPGKMSRGIHHDVDDIEAVRRHFGVEQISLIGHSYVGVTVILYAMKYPSRVDRIVQIGAAPARTGGVYPPHLTGNDATFAAFIQKMTELQQQPVSDPRERCRRFWDLIRELYVVNPEDMAKVSWTPCDAPNEYLHFMPHWISNVMPSMQALNLTAEGFARVTMPSLVVHGTRDRQSPYGAGQEWASQLPNARLLTVENAAHVPWIEAPDLVFGAIEDFLSS